MAPLKPVRTLYDFSLDISLVYIHRESRAPERFDGIRDYLIMNLHAGIRQQLINRAIVNFSKNVFDILDLIALLGDSNIKKLNLKHKGEFLTGYLSSQISSIIDDCNMIGLHELSFKMSNVLNSKVKNDTVSPALNYSLKRGLAQNLRVLILQNAADNQALGIIGRCANHLTNLDITSSWMVNDYGIRDLLFRDSQDIIYDWADSENYKTSILVQLPKLYDSQLNKTCFTLCEVRIQETNTSSVSDLLLLMFAKSLKSLGGFLYSRNIGDSVLEVQDRRKNSSPFSLSELWDMHLPYEKLIKLSRILPQLSTLYTRVLCLPAVPNMFPNLSSLTVDFDWVHYGNIFVNFLELNGSSIKRLTLIDQNYKLDLSKIALYCPLLEDLTAKVYVEDTLEEEASLKNLKAAKLWISSSRTFSWLMRKCDNIRELEIEFDRDLNEVEIFDNDVVLQVIEENPPSLQAIQSLSLKMFPDGGYEEIFLIWRTLTMNSAYALCAACDSLHLLGELHTWSGVTKKDVLVMADKIKQNNWDVQIRYRGALYPVS